MNTLMAWLSSEDWVHIVKALLHTLWLGAFAVAVLALILRGITDPAIRYRAALCALFFVVIGGLVAWAVMEQGTLFAGESSVPPPRPLLNASAQVQPQPVAGGTIFVGKQPLPIHQATSRPPWIAYLALVWLVGTGAMFLRAGWQLAGAERLRRATRPLQDESIAKIVDDLKSGIGLTRKVRIVVSEQIASPAVMGIFVPTLILPLSLLTTLTPVQLQTILLHELAHVQRGDYFVNLCQLVAESILFFNPAVWWISRQIRLEREACCDAIAISVAGEKTEYARTLVSVAEHISAALPDVAMAFGDQRHGSGLKDRIRRLLEPGYRPPIRLTWSALIGSLAFGTVVFLACAVSTLWTVTAAAKLLTPEERIAKIETTMREMKQLPVGDSADDESEEIPVVAHVKTVDGSPLPRQCWANFHVLLPRRSSGTGVAIGKGGICKAKVSKGDLYFSVSAEGYAPGLVGPIDIRTSNKVENIELTLDRGFDVKVVAIDSASRKPLRDAELTASFWVGSSSFFTLPAVMTDEKGEATLRHCAPLRMTVRVKKPGFETVNPDLDVPKSGKAYRLSTVPATPLGGTIVSSTTGKPVAGASVYIIGAYGDSGESGSSPGYLQSPLATTGGDGRFVANRLTVGSRYWLLVEAPGYEHKIFEDVTPGMANLQASLGPEMLVKGKVTGDLSKVRRSNKKPTLWVTRIYKVGENSTHQTGMEVPCKVVDGVGYFEFTNKLAGTVQTDIGGKVFEREITSSVDDWVIDVNTATNLTTKSREVVLLFRDPSGVAAKGTVQVTLPSLNQYSAYAKDIEITNGEVRCQAIVGRHFACEPQRTIGYWFKETNIFQLPDGNSPLVIPIPIIAAGAIYAQARNVDGSLVSDCSFSILEVKKSPLADPNSLTLPDGDSYSPDSKEPRKYVASPLPLKGKYAVVAHRKNSFAISESVELTEAAPDHSFELQFHKGAPIRGRVISPNGKGIPGATVRMDWYYKSHGFGLTAGKTDENGEFFFPDCTPEFGEYSVELHVPGMQSVRMPVKVNKLTEIKLKPGLKIAGQFLDAKSGRPIIDTEVRALAHQSGIPNDIPMEKTKTDKAGRFELTTLHDTKYRVHVDGAYFPNGSPLVNAGETQTAPFRVTVMEGARVKLGEKED